MLVQTNVFINCPFDDDYKALARPLLFGLISFGLVPQIAQTQSSADIRINQIKKFIRESKFSIHDLSRSKPMKKSDLPRFNMPYELGPDVGCAEFGAKPFRQKRILILETGPYQYQRVLSDVAGQDIESHNNDPLTLITKVRNWLSTADETRIYPSPNETWIAYGRFSDHIRNDLSGKGFTVQEIKNIPTADFIRFAKEWVADAKV